MLSAFYTSCLQPSLTASRCRTVWASIQPISGSSQTKPGIFSATGPTPAFRKCGSGYSASRSRKSTRRAADCSLSRSPTAATRPSSTPGGKAERSPTICSMPSSRTTQPGSPGSTTSRASLCLQRRISSTSSESEACRRRRAWLRWSHLRGGG
ncbi:hypothetical protein F5X97DRAFT_240879 [Nemania serpens]|nr:hypothetical protein F5X97DRAFT_240879 [Nemania serpens]